MLDLAASCRRPMFQLSSGPLLWPIVPSWPLCGGSKVGPKACQWPPALRSRARGSAASHALARRKGAPEQRGAKKALSPTKMSPSMLAGGYGKEIRAALVATTTQPLSIRLAGLQTREVCATPPRRPGAHHSLRAASSVSQGPVRVAVPSDLPPSFTKAAEPHQGRLARLLGANWRPRASLACGPPTH